MLSAQIKESTEDFPFSKKTELNPQALESIFRAKENISVELAPGFRLEGKIQHKTEHGNAVTSLLIKVESLPGGMLSISRFTDSHGNPVYSGRLLKLHEPEGLVLIENENHYYFIQTQQRFLITE